MVMCKLCFKEESTISATSDDVQSVVKIHFPFIHQKIINETNKTDPIICDQCWKFLQDFNAFYKVVEKIYSEVSMDDPIQEISKEVYQESLTEPTRNRMPRRAACKAILKNESTETSESNEIVVKKVPVIKVDKMSSEHAGFDKLITDFLNIKCVKCTADRFKNYANLKAHYRDKHPCHNQKEIYIQCHCGRNFNQRFQLAQHIKVHLNPNAFRCTICKATFTMARTLKMHIKAHQKPPTEKSRPEPKKYECNNCTKSYRNKQALEYHKVQHVPPDELKCICDICGKRYQSKNVIEYHILKVHQRAQTQIPHICPYCGMILKSASNLKYHVVRHEDPEAFNAKVQCGECGKWIKNGGQYRKHMRDHRSSHKVFQCPHCPKISPNAAALNGHIIYVHLTKRNFHCKFCEKSFKRKTELVEHESTHTGDSKFECSVCQKRFNCVANMYCHKKRVHSEEWRQEKLAEILTGVPKSAHNEIRLN